MKYWKVSLLREGRCAREWHVRAEVLTIGSHGSNKVRLPPPVESFALQFSELAQVETHQVGPFSLVVEDETHQRNELWTVACTRVEEAVSAASEAPREAPVPIRIAIATFTLLGLTNLAGSLFLDGRPEVMREYERTHPALVGMPRTGAPVPAPAAIFVAPIPERLALVAATPAKPTSLLFATAAAPQSVASSIVLVPQTPSIPTSSPGHSWDGAMMAYATEPSDLAGIPADWLSSTPARYRAPWPDAPVPPH